MKIKLLILSFFYCAVTQAQPDPLGSFNKHVIEQWTEQYLQVSQYRVKGSPYLLGESFDGQVTMTSGLKTQGKKILYSLYDQKAGFDINKELVTPDGEIASFYIQLPDKFGGEKMNFIPVSAFPDAKQKGYYNVVVDGPKASFMKLYKTRLVPDPQNLYTKDIRIFEQYTEYFIYNKTTKQVHKVRLKEKDIREALGAVNLPAGLEFESVSGVTRAVTEANNQ